MLRNLNMFPIKIAAGVIVFIIAMSVIFSSFFTVPSGHKGIVLNFNQLSRVVDPGLNFKVPFTEKVVIADVRTQKIDAPAVAGTKDIQTVSSNVTLNYHISPNSVGKVYEQTGLDVATRIIEPRIQEAVKATVALYSAEELLKRRDEVRSGIYTSLKKTLPKYNVIVEDIQITNFQFSENFSNSIEAKQIAEQQALKAENDLRRIEVEAKQKIEMAKAEAESIRIQSEAIRAQGGAEYVQLKAIAAWDGKLPSTMMSDSVPFVKVK